MNTSVRARRGARGFSFVELLVTIIIAGIAFAAMVPLFVQAQRRTRPTTCETSRLQIAQDKIEKIRQLSYEEIQPRRVWKARLRPAVSSARLGTSASPVVRPGRSRSHMTWIRCPWNAPSGQEKFKQITVTVRWTAPPTPVKDVVLVTRVYKQNAGPPTSSRLRWARRTSSKRTLRMCSPSWGHRS